MKRLLPLMMVVAACSGATNGDVAASPAAVPVSVTTVTVAATVVTTTIPGIPAPATSVAASPPAEPIPRFDLSGGAGGTDFATLVREYNRLIRWVYLHPDRLSETQGHFMPEGPAYTYLQEVTARFRERGWRVDLGLWEPTGTPLLVAGGMPSAGFAAMYVTYRKQAGSPIFDSSTGAVVDMLPPFDRQVFRISLRYFDDGWKVFADEKPLAG